MWPSGESILTYKIVQLKYMEESHVAECSVESFMKDQNIWSSISGAVHVQKCQANFAFHIGTGYIISC